MGELFCRRHSSSFADYYSDFFFDSYETSWFHRFLRIARENFRLANTDDMDYQALKKVCSPSTKDMLSVAAICYRHNETAFREEMMEFADLARNRGIKRHRKKDIRFLRRRYYYYYP